MGRRSFVKSVRDGVSGSFLVGGLGGTVVGGGSVALYAAHDRRLGTLSYAQQGEDLVVNNILDMVRVKGPITYVDIGAYDPIFCSNSYAFYLSGGHGVLVEPNPSKIERLRKVRPRDKVLNVGVGLSADRPPATITSSAELATGSSTPSPSKTPRRCRPRVTGRSSSRRC
jgi:hypothetical protein